MHISHIWFASYPLSPVKLIGLRITKNIIMDWRRP